VSTSSIIYKSLTLLRLLIGCANGGGGGGVGGKDND